MIIRGSPSNDVIRRVRAEREEKQLLQRKCAQVEENGSKYSHARTTDLCGFFGKNVNTHEPQQEQLAEGEKEREKEMNQ